MAFRANARYFLLTYSQSEGLDEWAVVSKLGDLGGECIVGREYHKAGGVHHHVFVDFGRKFRSRKTDVFDVGGFHPNIEPTRRTPSSGYDYAIKDGEVVAGGLARPEPRSIGSGATYQKWAEITSAGSRDEFWALCEELDPKSLVTSFPSLQKYADWAFRDIPTPYATPPGVTFDISGATGCDDWLQQSGIGLGETRAKRCGPGRSANTFILEVYFQPLKRLSPQTPNMLCSTICRADWISFTVTRIGLGAKQNSRSSNCIEIHISCAGVNPAYGCATTIHGLLMTSHLSIWNGWTLIVFLWKLGSLFFVPVQS
uniref:Replication-associated protein n=1 Tax=Syrmaticus reevesii Genomoviridae sp. TaxID=2814996 RepID=A0A8E7G2D3_9VIRU